MTYIDEKPSILDANVLDIVGRLERAWEHHKRERDSQPVGLRIRELDSDVLTRTDALLCRVLYAHTDLDAAKVERLNEAYEAYWDVVEWFETTLEDFLDSVRADERRAVHDAPESVN
jgi:hypothetical protein